MAKKATVLRIEGLDVNVTNLDKVLYPESGFTKGQVIDYYVRAAPLVLPHLRDRPMTMKRYPDGTAAEHFYEKDAPRFTPDWVKTFGVKRKTGGTIDYVVVNDLATLVWLANLASLELHPFLHKAPEIDSPTAMVFDLDPGEPATALTAIEVAAMLRERLSRVGLECFPKWSGSKGVHVYVPLNSGVKYAETQPFAKKMAEDLAAELPKLVTAEMAKKVRAGKVFIDWSQNSDFKTTVAPYSLRGKFGYPTVAYPVTWEELLKVKDPEKLQLTPETALKRFAKKGDLLGPVLTVEQRLGGTDPLKKYRGKRHFEITPEPAPGVEPEAIAAGRPRFVIQKHAASHLHYDFRLEMEGVLKSWAVPKGPPMATQVRRLAMETEDHPIGYLDFEGIIPKGQYGGGTVMVWDIGTYELLEGNYEKGNLKFRLAGEKLKGDWRLVKSRGREERDQRSWYLLKSGGSQAELTPERDDESALSHRTMEQIRTEQDAVWRSKRLRRSVSRMGTV